MERDISSVTDLSRLAEDIVSSIVPREDRAFIIGLSGDLGAGKTAFTKEIAGSLGVREEVTSPTFVIEKRYATDSKKFSSLVHIDAYRLKDETELMKIRFGETMSVPDRLIVIEWPELVQKALPDDTPVITFIEHPEGKRIAMIPEGIL
jgi:tRNA threonylcarbamoyladenosine biosynthesis protein TsaE